MKMIKNDSMRARSFKFLASLYDYQHTPRTNCDFIWSHLKLSLLTIVVFTLLSLILLSSIWLIVDFFWLHIGLTQGFTFLGFLIPGFAMILLVAFCLATITSKIEHWWAYRNLNKKNKEKSMLFCEFIEFEK